MGCEHVLYSQVGHLGLDRMTLYLYVNGDGTPKARGQALLRGPVPAR
jgi:hypothetical protein